MFLYALVWVTDMNYWYYLGTYLSIELLSAMVLVPWNASRGDDQPLQRAYAPVRRAYDVLGAGRLFGGLGSRYYYAVHRSG